MLALPDDGNRYELFGGEPADLTLDGEQLAQPDLFVILGPPIGSLSWKEVPAPALVSEVVSPGTARPDRKVKRGWYQRSGIEYWIVDPDARVVERWKPEDQRPEFLDRSLQWEPRAGTAPLELNVAGLFAEAFGPVQRI